MVGITLDEKLQFMEYFTLFFSFNRYYTTQQWNIVMEYISSNPEIHEIFLKGTLIISIDAVRVSDIKAYINKVRGLLFYDSEVVQESDESLFQNNMQLFAIIKPQY